MKFYVAVALLVVAPCIQGEGQSCQGQSDCASDECCVYNAPFRGRRDTSGVCRGRGTSSQRCYVENRFQQEGRFANICPCASGFACKSSGVNEVPFGEVGTCSPVAHAVKSGETPCNTGADCPSDHCCHSNFQPIGRRQALSLSQKGVCKPMGTSGSHCYVNSGSGKPDHMTFTCPCSTGFHCKGFGFFEVPLGEVGQCVAGKRAAEEGEDDVSCQSGADCPGDQCCVDLNRPIGRRQAPGGSTRVCRPMGTKTSSCLAKSKPGKPDHVVFVCPCSTGLHCKPNGVFDVPLGELGNCVADSP